MGKSLPKLPIIWDLDGTLIDSSPEIIQTIKRALLKNGIGEKCIEKPFRIGPPVKNIIRNSISNDYLSEKMLDEVVKDFRDIYDNSDYKSTVIFDGINEILSDTIHFEHYIITNKPDLATKRIVKYKGWSDYISEIYTPTSFRYPMKKIDLFVYFKEQHPNIMPVSIGDMQLDCLCAKNISATAIGVLWGAGTKSELKEAGCDYIVEDVSGLKALLKDLWQRR